MGTSVLIADGSGSRLTGLRTIIDRESDIEVVGSTVDERASLRLTATLAPDILILDSSLFGDRVIQVINEVTRDFPSIHVLVLGDSEFNTRAASYRAGASLCLKPNSTPTELILAIRTIARGEANSVSDLSHRAGQMAAGKTSSHDTPLSRILVVDDDEAVRQMLVEVLEVGDIDCVVQSATNVFQALKIIPEFRPHLLITDLLMPQVNGVELLRWVKSNGFSSMSVLVITGNEHDGLLDSAIAAGADNWLTKPLGLKTFNRTVWWMLAQKNVNSSMDREASI